MATYISPNGNPEVWTKKPEGYFSPEEWEATHPPAEAEVHDPERERQERALAIKAELAALDMAGIRALRAIENGTDIVEDHQRLLDMEKRAAQLRAELAGLLNEPQGGY